MPDSKSTVLLSLVQVQPQMYLCAHEGGSRGKLIRTVVPDTPAACPLNRVLRQFRADRPNQLWVADITYVSTWQGCF